MTLSSAEQTRLRESYGPWALITGASSGIGQEIATQLAASGLNLLLVARNEVRLSELAQSLKQAHGIQTEILSADLASSEGVAQTLAATQSYELGLAVLSAGYGTSGEFLQANISDEVNMLRVNCEALLTMTHAIGQRFAQQGHGGLILMSSLVAFQGVPYSAHYAATKAYVQSLAEAIAIELKPSGVDVLAAAPGPVASGFGSRANMNMNGAMAPDQVGVPILKALGRRNTVLPGFLTKVLTYSLRTMPRWAKIRVMKMVMGGMTQHQRAMA